MVKRLFLFAAAFWYCKNLYAQQDSTLNNLVLPAGMVTCNTGELGKVSKAGSGKQSIIIISGFGFGESEMQPLISHFKNNYTVYTITAAGFGATPPPPMPDDSVKYSELTWTNGLVTGIVNLIVKEKLNKPIIIAHFVTATQTAINLELQYADKIGKVIIISGSPYRYYASQKNGQWSDWEHELQLTAEKRENLIERYWAPQWLKTVTKKTWDDNMWTPDDYCKDSAKGKSFFQVSANVPVQVMIRYLLEWMAYDESGNYNKIRNPTLILIPGFDEIVNNTDSTNTEACKRASAKQYLKYFHQQSWQPAMHSGNAYFHFETIADARIFMWLDSLERTFQIIDDFLQKN